MVTYPLESYCKACQFLVRKIDLNDELSCSSVYFNLLTESEPKKEQKLNNLIQILKETSLSKFYNITLLYDFTRQFISLFNYEIKNFGESFFDKQHVSLYQTLFEIFIKTKDNEIRKVCFFVANNLRKRKTEMKTTKRTNFTEYCIKNLMLLSNHYYNLESFNYKRFALDEEKSKYLETFSEFLDVFTRTLILPGKQSCELYQIFEFIIIKLIVIDFLFKICFLPVLAKFLIKLKIFRIKKFFS